MLMQNYTKQPFILKLDESIWNQIEKNSKHNLPWIYYNRIRKLWQNKTISFILSKNRTNWINKYNSVEILDVIKQSSRTK